MNCPIRADSRMRVVSVYALIACRGDNFIFPFSTLLFFLMTTCCRAMREKRRVEHRRENKIISSTSDQGINAHHSHPRVSSDRSIDLARLVRTKYISYENANQAYAKPIKEPFNTNHHRKYHSS